MALGIFLKGAFWQALGGWEPIFFMGVGFYLSVLTGQAWNVFLK
jgi:hypothetical protein